MSRRSLCLTALTVAVLGITTGQAKAQFSWTYWQVPVGPVKIMENDLDRQIIEGFNLGLISPQERADLSRDLDGIRVTEERYRASGGINPWAQAHLLGKLELFKLVLGDHMRASQSVAATTVIQTK